MTTAVNYSFVFETLVGNDLQGPGFICRALLGRCCCHQVVRLEEMEGLLLLEDQTLAKRGVFLER